MRERVGVDPNRLLGKLRHGSMNKGGGMYARTDYIQTNQRLNYWLALNAETARRHSMFRTEAEKRAYQMMSRPLNSEETFATLGGFLGTFTPASIYLKIYFSNAGSMGWVLGMFVLANIITAFAGYYLGALIGKIARMTEEKDWITMTVFLFFLGGAWGAVSGFIGGLIILIIGAFVGGFFGLFVGAAALPIFTIFHRILSVRGYIDRRQAIPLAAGISLIISAYIFGF
jgi:hypothetical protein